MKRFHIIIPARYESTRLPGKPLADLGGKPMIVRVFECARDSGAQSVAIATDDRRIASAADAGGARVVMTSPAHRCGAERVAEAAAALGFAKDEIVVNVQGDEPRMPPKLIAQVAAALDEHQFAAIATASTALVDDAQWRDASAVKVIVDCNHRALYFSRAPIGAIDVARRHVGIYAYRAAYLQRFASRGECPLEQREQLEQLRALWHGETIVCVDAVAVPPPGIDTAENLADAQRYFNALAD